MQDIFKQRLITLRESDHKYFVKPYPNLKFTSVTTLLHEYFTPFESEKIANELAGHGKYAEWSVQDLLDDWEQSGVTGTKVHKALEEFKLHGVIPENPHIKARHGINWIYNNNILEDYHVFAEVMLFSADLQIAGTVDVILQHKITGKFYMLDYKTNKKISKSAMYGATGISNITKHLPDCNFQHYTLQMSIYQYLLETEYNIKIESRTIVHLLDKPTRNFPEGVRLYPTEYYKAEVAHIFAERLEKKRAGKLHEFQLFD